MFDNFLNALGVKAGVIMAAFGGGIVRIAVFGSGGASPLASVVSVVGGTITAVFLGPIGPTYLGWPASGQSTLAVTFLVGVFFMEVLKQIAGRLTQWQPTIKGSKNA